MSDAESKQTLNRRALLKGALAGLAAVPGIAAMDRAAAATPIHLDEKDPAAAALGYVHDASKVDAAKNPTYKNGQHCANCLQVQGKDADAWRGCNLFPGKLVNAKGWCKVWVQKPV